MRTGQLQISCSYFRIACMFTMWSIYRDNGVGTSRLSTSWTILSPCAQIHVHIDSMSDVNVILNSAHRCVRSLNCQICVIDICIWFMDSISCSYLLSMHRPITTGILPYGWAASVIKEIMNAKQQTAIIHGNLTRFLLIQRTLATLFM
jgi:hypothetical protein